MNNMSENQLVQFGKYGTIGVVLASLATVIIFGSIIYKMSDKFADSTQSTNEAINKNTEVLSSLKTLIENK